ncbi:MAG: hypothetical protein WD601_04850, partial [Pseudohongiellaceae bacterium]
IEKAYRAYRFDIVKDLGRGRYLLKFDPDPGLESLKDIAQHTETIHFVQPNFSYQPGISSPGEMR